MTSVNLRFTIIKMSNRGQILIKISPGGVLNFSFLSPNKFFAKFLAQPMPNPKHNE